MRRERPAERGALLLAAGDLVRVTVGLIGQVDQLEQLVDAAPDLLPGLAAHLQREGDVLADGHVGEERVGLEDHADRPLAGGHVGQVAPGDLDDARIGPLEPGDAAEQRRLAAARGAEERDELARRHLERDVVERPDLSEAFADPLQRDPAHQPSVRSIAPAPGRRRSVWPRFQ